MEPLIAGSLIEVSDLVKTVVTTFKRFIKDSLFKDVPEFHFFLFLCVSGKF